MLVKENSSCPLVSVVMCAYNVRAYIEEAVNSILQQTYTNIELIISDDGSTDGTREWLKELESHPKVRLYFQDRNLGYVANKNFVISKATGTYITQNDSDDLSDLRRLEKQIAVCKKDPNVKIVATGYHKIDLNGNSYSVNQPPTDMLFTKYSGNEYPFWFPPLLVHREVFDRIGLFTQYFAGMGDDLYWTVKANEQYDIYFLKDDLYAYRYNPNSITNVLNNDRKLIVGKLLSKILEQRKLKGIDWLEENDFESLSLMEAELLNNSKFMAEQYRIWAAKAVDKKDWSLAKKLLKESYKKNALNFDWYRTMVYYLCRR